MRFAPEKKDIVMIAAHRGVAGGNVPCNSLTAYKAALRQGADIIELDVTKSQDGVLYVFHPGMEPVFLKSDTLITQMDSARVDSMYLRNQDTCLTQYHVPYLRDAFELLRGKCYINIDKFWDCPLEISKLVREYNMQDQVLIKTDASEENFRRVEEIAPDLPYMVITRDTDEFTESLLRRNMRYVGVEALFSADDAPVAQKSYTEYLNKNGLIAWVNSILFSYKTLLAGMHTDDVAVSESEDATWGWMVERGFGIIQTDWTLSLRTYLQKIGKHA